MINIPVLPVSASAPTNIALGSVRHNTSTLTTEIFDGVRWVTIDGASGSYKFTDDELCAMHPGLQELREEVKAAQEKYNAFKALCQEKK